MIAGNEESYKATYQATITLQELDELDKRTTHL